MGKLKAIKEAVEAASKRLDDYATRVVYHGSPHDFPAERLVEMADGSRRWVKGTPGVLPEIPAGATLIRDEPLGRFDLTKMGTGEGAQAYGAGAYLSDSRRIGEGYRDGLSGRRFNVGGTEIEPSSTRSTRAFNQTKAQNIAADALDDAFNAQSNSPAQYATNRLRQQRQMYPEDAADVDEAMGILADWESSGAQGPKSAGKLYRAEIPTSDYMLDWDATIDELTPHVQQGLQQTDWWEYAEESLWNRNSDSNPTGRDIYNWLLEDYTPEEASLMLKDAGIVGINYVGDSSGVRNAVVFDDQLIKVLEKGNVDPRMLAALGVAAGGAVYAQNSEAGVGDDILRAVRKAGDLDNAAMVAAKQALESSKSVKAVDILGADHRVFVDYPDLVNIPVRLDARVKGAEYNHLKNAITLQDARLLNNDQTLLHELSHAVDFTKPGGPSVGEYGGLEAVFGQINITPELKKAYDDAADLIVGRLGMAPDDFPDWESFRLADDAMEEIDDLAYRAGRLPTFGAVANEPEVEGALSILKNELRKNYKSPDTYTHEFPGEINAEAFAKKYAKQLDMSQSARMARAGEQGFDTSLYHGTNQAFDAFDLEEAGHAGAVWLTDAEWYARMMAEGRAKKGGSPQVMKLRAKIKNPKTFDILAEGRRVAEEIGVDLPETSMEAQELLSGGIGWDSVVGDMVYEAKQEGYDALILKNFNDNQLIDSTATMVFDPANLRSEDAAFNLANIGKNDLMGSIDPRLLAPVAAAGAAGGYAMQNYAPAELPPLDPAYGEFARRRAAKIPTWRQLREATLTMGSAMAGGIVGDLSRLGGYLNPLMPVERTEQGAQAIENRIMIPPTQRNAILEGLGRGIEQASEDFAPITDAIPQSIPGRLYNALPERAQGLLRIGADLAL